MLLGITVVLIALLRRAQHTEKEPKSHAQTAQTIIEAWERENDRLLETVTDVHRQLSARLTKLEERVNSLENQWKESGCLSADRIEPSFAGERESVTAPSLHERYPDVFEMAEQGLSASEIAKATGRGRGEIQLIIGLAARRDDHV